MSVAVGAEKMSFYLFLFTSRSNKQQKDHKTSSVEVRKTKKHKDWKLVKLFFQFVRLYTFTQRFTNFYMKYLYIFIYHY